MPAAAKPAAPKRRNRKRKRRAASSSSSSSASSDSDSESPVEQPKSLVPQKITPSDHESSSESSESDSDSGSGSDVSMPAAASITTKTQTQPQPQRSPSPPPAQIPSFIPEKTAAEPTSAAELEVKFRKFWMTAVADGFSEDLDELRKESNLSKARLEMLVHSLASGTEVFDKDEMEVVLG